MIDYESLLKTTKAYNTIVNDLKNNTLSHCYMFCSEDELACNNLCELVARFLLCKNNNCGKCKDCVQFESRSHRSLIVLNTYNADSIRDLIMECSYKVEDDRKVVLIENFQEIDPKEQNRLLKLIEEPIKGLVFIMGVTKISSVLDTIKSRAKKITIETFLAKDIKNELLKLHENDDRLDLAVTFSEGSISRAVNMLNNSKYITSYLLMKDILIKMKKSSQVVDMLAKIKEDSKFKTEDVQVYLNALEIILNEIIQYKSGLNDNIDGSIMLLAENFNYNSLVNIEDLIIESRQKLDQYCNVDSVMESLLMRILEVKYKCQ